MKATDHVKRAAYNKAVDYLLEDPENHVRKIMDLLDKAAPDDLFPSQRKAFRTAIDSQNNWYQLIMKVLDLNPEVRDTLLRTFIVDANLMARAGEESRKARLQHPLGGADGSHERLQPALHRLLGG